MYKTLKEIEALNAQGNRKSWAPYVNTGDPEYSTNALRFESKDECERYCDDLQSRWYLVRDYSAVVSDDEPSHSFDVNRELVRLEDVLV